MMSHDSAYIDVIQHNLSVNNSQYLLVSILAYTFNLLIAAWRRAIEHAIQPHYGKYILMRLQ